MNTTMESSTAQKDDVLSTAAEEFFKDANFEKFFPADAGFPGALGHCTSQNFTVAGRAPPAIFFPVTAVDVSLVLKFLSQHSVKATVCGGGHSEFSVKDEAAVVSLREMNSVVADKDNLTVTFGGGALLGPIGDELAKYGLAAPVGTFWSVGCGLVLQGGIGHLTRIRSLACDNILELEVVLPNGEIVVLNDNSPDQELWWAMRGAGSCFGVATKFKLSVHPVEKVITANSSKKVTVQPNGETFEADLEEFAVYMANCEELLRNLPDHQHVDQFLNIDVDKENGNVTISVYFKIASLDPEDSFSEELQKTLGFDASDVNEMSYIDFSTARESEQSSHGISSFIRTIWIDKIGKEYWIKSLKTLLKAPTPLCGFSLQHTGGNSRKEKPNNGCLNCRNFEFSCVLISMWNEEDAAGMSPDEVENKFRKWIDELFAVLTPIATGAYPADIDLFRRPAEAELDAELAFGKETLARLGKVKQRVDPSGLILVHIPLTQPAPGMLKCCADCNFM